jgi:prophage regulatory protein
MQKLISWDDLPEAARYSKQHLRILEKQGKFPKRVPLSPFRHAWVESEIVQWVADRIAERDAALAPRAA